MAQSTTALKLKQTETEVAVLQVQYSHLNEKVDDIKTSLKDLQSHIDTHMVAINTAIENSKHHFETALTALQEENKKQHGDLEKKVSALEKWRWMMMGAGVFAGAMGWPVMAKMFGM
jgi:predicted RNase H-like nuclease (RuvC/YqgF family)